MCQSIIEIMGIVLIFPYIHGAIGSSENVTQSPTDVHSIKYNNLETVPVNVTAERIFRNCSFPVVKLWYIDPNSIRHFVSSKTFNQSSKTKPLEMENLDYGFESVDFYLNKTDFMLSAEFSLVTKTANGKQFLVRASCDMSTVGKEIMYDFKFVLENGTTWTTKSPRRENRTTRLTESPRKENGSTWTTKSARGENRTTRLTESSRKDSDSNALSSGEIGGIIAGGLCVFVLLCFGLWKKCYKNSKESPHPSAGEEAWKLN